MSGYSDITVKAQGRYRVDGGDWSVNDPDFYPDPEIGKKKLEYDDPEAPPPPQHKNEILNNNEIKCLKSELYDFSLDALFVSLMNEISPVFFNQFI